MPRRDLSRRGIHLAPRPDRAAHPHEAFPACRNRGIPFAGFRAQTPSKGKVVAAIGTHGFVETSNAMGDAGVASGPLLAEARAEKIAAAVPGAIVHAPTAMSQSAFYGVPHTKATVDDAAMRRDPRYAELERLKQARAVFLAQQMAQGGAARSAASGNAVQSKSASSAPTCTRSKSTVAAYLLRSRQTAPWSWSELMPFRSAV